MLDRAEDAPLLGVARDRVVEREEEVHLLRLRQHAALPGPLVHVAGRDGDASRVLAPARRLGRRELGVLEIDDRNPEHRERLVNAADVTEHEIEAAFAPREDVPKTKLVAAIGGAGKLGVIPKANQVVAVRFEVTHLVADGDDVDRVVDLLREVGDHFNELLKQLRVHVVIGAVCSRADHDENREAAARHALGELDHLRALYAVVAEREPRPDRAARGERVLLELLRDQIGRQAEEVVALEDEAPRLLLDRFAIPPRARVPIRVQVDDVLSIEVMLERRIIPGPVVPLPAELLVLDGDVVRHLAQPDAQIEVAAGREQKRIEHRVEKIELVLNARLLPVLEEDLHEAMRIEQEQRDQRIEIAAHVVVDHEAVPIHAVGVVGARRLRAVVARRLLLRHLHGGELLDVRAVDHRMGRRALAARFVDGDAVLAALLEEQDRRARRQARLFVAPGAALSAHVAVVRDRRRRIEDLEGDRCEVRWREELIGAGADLERAAVVDRHRRVRRVVVLVEHYQRVVVGLIDPLDDQADLIAVLDVEGRGARQRRVVGTGHWEADRGDPLAVALDIDVEGRAPPIAAGDGYDEGESDPHGSVLCQALGLQKPRTSFHLASSSAPSADENRVSALPPVSVSALLIDGNS